MTSLLKPEARRALLKEAGYSDQFIEEFEQGENQKISQRPAQCADCQGNRERQQRP